MSKKQMNFLPEDYVEQKIERRTNLICLALFLVVMLGVGGAYVVTMRQRAEVRQKQQAVNRAFANAARRLDQLEELQKRKKKMLYKAQVTASLVARVPRTFLLADLINRMPSSLSLLRLELTSKKDRSVARLNRRRSAMANRKESKKGDKVPLLPPPPPPTIVSVAMTGVAPTDVQVAQYMAALSRSPLLTDVNLLYTEQMRIQGAVMRRFEIEMKLEPDADVRKLDPLRLERHLEKNPLAGVPSAVGAGVRPSVGELATDSAKTVGRRDGGERRNSNEQ